MAERFVAGAGPAYLGVTRRLPEWLLPDAASRGVGTKQQTRVLVRHVHCLDLTSTIDDTFLSLFVSSDITSQRQSS